MKSESYVKYTHCLWLCYILIICLLVLFSKTIHFASSTYFQAAANWLTEKPLYGSQPISFIYFPQTAMVYSLFSKLPTLLYEILFRLFTLSFLWYGLYRFSKLNPYGKAPFFFFIMSVVTMILGLEAALIGQLNILVVDGMLLIAVAILDEQWWIAALTGVVIFMLCPAMLVMLLLTRTLYSSVLVRAIFLLIGAIILPFFFQHAEYVWQQYAGLHKLAVAVTGTDLQWPQLWSLLGHLGIILSAQWQAIISLILGVGLFILCAQIKDTFARPQYCVILYSMAAIFLMLFNPHTTMMDYIIIAPVFGFVLASAIAKGRICFFIISICIVLGLLATTVLSLLLSLSSISWIPPLLMLIFFMVFLIGTLPYFEFIKKLSLDFPSNNR